MDAFRSLLLLGLMAIGRLSLADAEHVVRVDNRDSLMRALTNARPGDRILLASGTYSGNVFVRKIAGTRETPIVIAAVDPKQPPVIQGDSQFSAVRFIEIRDLIFERATTNGINIDDGGARDGSPQAGDAGASEAEGIVLSNLVVRDIGPRGNKDGIKLSGLVDFRVEGCRVERWGSGGSAIDMVGCRNGVISKCTFQDVDGSEANGVQTKGGSRDIVVRRCHFKNAGSRAINVGGSTGLPFFRPKPEGFEARDITVEDCNIVGGESAIAFVGVDGATVRHCTIVRPSRWIFRILQENTAAEFVPCRNVVIASNLVVFRSDEIRQALNIGGGTTPETFRFEGNVWNCLDQPERTERLVQLPTKETDGRYGIDPGFRDADAGDFRLKTRGPDDPGVRDVTPVP
jgi:hypothetical protein